MMMMMIIKSLIHQADSEILVTVCNTMPGLSREMYGLYPVLNTAECINRAAYDKQDNDECSGARFSFLCNSKAKINARAERCNALQTLLNAQASGINARIPASQTEGAVYDNVGIDRAAYSSIDFVPFSNKLVKWRSVALVRRQGLPRALFSGAALSFSASRKTFVNKGIPIVEGLTIQTDARNDFLIMNGCSLPTFKFTVKWTNEGGCWTRRITVTVSPSPDSCVQLVSSNSVREYRTKPDAIAFIQSYDWSATGVKFPIAYAELIYSCAQDGKWTGQSSTTPGTCTACAVKQAAGVRVVSCNRTLQQPDCCFGCAPATHMPQPGSAELKCVPKCAPGTYYSSSSWCAPCPSGQFSAGGLAPCLPCAVLLGDPNTVYSEGGGCRACGRSAMALGGVCTPCPAGTYVPPGATACRTCELRGHFVSRGSVCLPCAPGTFLPAGGSECVICPTNTYAPANGSTACLNCPVGHVSSMYTKCDACPPINASLMPFAQYYQRGCNIRCAPLISYVRTSPYIRNGCGSCASVVAPVGAYISPSDCTVMPPCTPPPKNAYHATNGTRADNCEWKCNAGFQRAAAACAPCPTAAFVPLRHVYLRECQYTCRPNVYVDVPTLFCNVSCVNLLDEVAAGRIHARVREYFAGSLRPNYVLGVCGNNETLPKSNVLFLRRGRWAMIMNNNNLPVCGNSLLNTNEECDDGNTRSGDGCSSACRVELSAAHKWECDLIGAPCVRDCGWSFKSPGPNGVGLIGFYLPPDAANCSELSYRYNVEPLSPYARANWMKNNLMRCDTCGARTLPFSECNATNGGCRQCAADMYHDDVRGMCVACGSTCPPGYMRGPCTHGSSDAAAATGCVACPVPQGPPVRFVQGCAYTCPPETSYCRTTPLANSVCTSTCGSCEHALSALINGGTAPPSGSYTKGCAGVNGYTWAPCDTLSRPTGAVWTSNSNSGSAGCAWKCAPQYVAWRGTCVPTFKYTAGPAPCIPGQRLQWSSSTGSSEAVCLPCVGALSGAYQTWTSDPPFFTTCRPACNPSVSYQLTPNATECIPCSNPNCNAGEYFVPCTTASEATCMPCPSPPPPNSAYYAGGDCKTKCVAGNYYSNAACVSCDTLPLCAAGTFRETQCDMACKACPAPPPNTVWTSLCATQCAPGFVMTPLQPLQPLQPVQPMQPVQPVQPMQQCQLCDPATMCQHGGECALDQLVCYDAEVVDEAVVEVEVAVLPVQNEDKVLMGGAARPDLTYPTRRHR